MGRKTFSFSERGFMGNAFVERLPLVGKSLYFPRGPHVTNDLAWPDIQKLGIQTGAFFVRVEPITEAECTHLAQVATRHFRRAPENVQPVQTLVMDISPSEELLLSQMKSKTRYNIRLAEKNGIEVRRSRDSKDVELFFKLIRSTAGLKGLRTYPQEHYQTILDAFGDQAELFFAEYQGQALAASLICFSGSTATYLHGGTREEQRSLMAPYRMHWEVIQEAKRRGMTRYDWGGIAEDGETRSGWAGITRFKRGFAPQTPATIFPGTFDIVLDPFRYALYRLLRTLNRWVR
ncbi:MAG: peptidoglycan bridge formation glycyltransferase FemA/FemB family protein [Candidatus Moraniibacteriota bacterium]